MSFKKATAIMLAVVFALAAFAMAASADGTVTVGGAKYKVVTPKTVAITGEGVSPSFRGNGSIDVLSDGDIARTVTNHDNKGIVLITNDEIVARATVPVVQDLDNIPTAYIEMDFGSEVSFDTAYMAIYWQQAGIYEPDGNKVIVETSSDGTVWVPAGTDGVFYFSMPKCPDWKEGLPNSEQGYPYVGEVAVPLGETVKARYVRYAYTFPVLEEGSHWTFYTNVAEFIGFTEVGVATFESGRKPKVLSASDVASRPAIEGSWAAEDGEEVTVVTFSDVKGELEYTETVYDKADYIANGADAEALDTVEGNYFIEGNKVALITGDGYDDCAVSIDGDGNLVLELDGDEIVYTAADGFTAANPGEETSGDESSDEETSGDESEASEATSADGQTSVAESSTSNASSGNSSTGNESSGETIKPNGNAAGGNTGADSTSTEAEESGSGSLLWIILGAVGGVAVIAAVVIIVVKKKKA